MYEHILNLSVISLIPFFFEYTFVQLDSLELDHYEAYIHRKLKEYQPYAFRHKFIRGGSEIDRGGPEYGETCDHKYELCQCFWHPLLLIPRIKGFNVF